MPHKKSHVLADVHQGGPSEVERAIEAAGDAWEDWSRLAWEERAAVFLRAAELLSGPWRSTLNAATMLGQSKTAHQAEIDAACEVIDFYRFNVEFMARIYEEQPVSSQGVWNRMEYRPLEGFVLAVSPFNFTAIGANLPGERGADGQHRRLEARKHRGLLGALPDAAPPGGGPPPGRDQPRPRPRRQDRRRGPREPGSRRRALHGLDRSLQLDVEHDRLQHRRVPQLPADRRRDRRQGLHRRAPLSGRERGRDGHRPRLLRVPGPEVLGRVARLRAVEPLARAARAARRGGGPDQDGRRRPTSRTSWAPSSTRAR